MISHSLLLVLLVLACLQPFTTAEPGKRPDKCCFSFQKYRVPVRVIETYTETERECPKDGIIFTLKNGRDVCADPGMNWVKNIIKLIDQRLFESPAQNQTGS